MIVYAKDHLLFIAECLQESYESWLPLISFQNVCYKFLTRFVGAEICVHLMQLLLF